MGRKNFNENDAVPLSNIARYNGDMAIDLSVWAADTEGIPFVKMLPKNKQEPTLEQSYCYAMGPYHSIGECPHETTMAFSLNAEK